MATRTRAHTAIAKRSLIFITDAVMSGMPLYIAQVIAGHTDINTTMGYRSTPDEAIQPHLAFLAGGVPTGSPMYQVPGDEE